MILHLKSNSSTCQTVSFSDWTVSISNTAILPLAGAWNLHLIFDVFSATLSVLLRLSGPKSCQVPVSCTSRPFPRSTTRALIAVLLVSYFDHCKNQLLRLCLWSIPLPIHLTWYHQINFLKCHFHFVNFHYKTQMLSDNQWKNARLSLAFQVQSYQNSLSPLYVISR